MKSPTSLFSPVGVGIDFGTYKSAIAFMGLEHREPKLVVIRPGNLEDDPYLATSLPTRISLSINPDTNALNVRPDDGRYLDLPNQEKDGVFIASRFKMYMGGNWPDDESKEIDKILKRPISILGLAGKILDTLNDSLRSQIRNSFLAVRTKQYVITVPPKWDYRQRNATIHASILGSIKNSRLIEEPLAAAIFLINSGIYNPKTQRISLIIDFGAGTCDIALIDSEGRGLRVLDAISIQYGGTNIDDALLNGLLRNKENSEYSHNPKGRVLKKNNRNVRHIDFMAILEKITELKHEFGASDTTRRIQKHAKFSDFVIDLSREEFQTIIDKELRDNFDGIFANFLKTYETRIQAIGQVFIVGGSSQLPGLHERVKNILQQVRKTGIAPDVPVIPGPEWCVAKGAAILSRNNLHAPFAISSRGLPEVKFDPEELQLLHGEFPTGSGKKLPIYRLLVFKARKNLGKIEFQIKADGEKEPRDIFTIVPLHEKEFAAGSRISVEYEAGIDNLVRLKPQVLYPRQKIHYSYRVFELSLDETQFKQEYQIGGVT